MARSDGPKANVPEAVISAMVNWCSKNASSPEERQRRLEKLVASKSFQQLVGVIGFSSEKRLIAEIETRSARRLRHLLDLEHAGFIHLKSGEGVGASLPGLGLLRESQYWHLLPCGLAIEADGAIVVFDWHCSPIVRLRVGASPELVHPEERIAAIGVRWFYEDATAPYLDPDTLNHQFFIVDLLGVRDEMSFCWSLSDFGRLPPGVWGPPWETRA